MNRKKENLVYRFLSFFTVHPWLKLISLILAILVWLYVRGEVNKFEY